MYTVSVLLFRILQLLTLLLNKKVNLKLVGLSLFILKRI